VAIAPPSRSGSDPQHSIGEKAFQSEGEAVSGEAVEPQWGT
jgi:hypothetical protein